VYSITRVVAFDTEILLTDVILNRILRENKRKRKIKIKIKYIYINIYKNKKTQHKTATTRGSTLQVIENKR
jgi:hypothetical protein